MATREKTLQHLTKLRAEALKDCWKYHGEMIKRESGGACKSKAELEDYFGDISLEDWEDVGFFVGKLAGIDEAIDKLCEK